MKPEIYKEWEQALSYLEKAEKLYEVGKFQEAPRKANGAITFGIHTIHALAEELKIPDLLVSQENAFYEWTERMSPEFGENTIHPRKPLNGFERLLKDYLMNYHQTH
ncbi:MAG: hypothetical protein ACYTBX_14345 [Planctomycetota bacterium]|jgi:hypothetical protein